MCVGPLKRVCHWGPLVALGIIKAVTMATVTSLSQWWPPHGSWGGTAVFMAFSTSAVLTLYFFLTAMYTGPGTLPNGWYPENREDAKFLQYCTTCEGYKSPRAHHCRKCGRCVMKMDHHCPWINNCVGHRNHGAFTMFLFYAVVGCSQATVILAICIYHAIHRTWYLYYGTGREPLVYMSQWGIIICMFVLGLAIGVVLAVGMLLYFQLRSILRNRTGIEDWILEKAIHRRGPDQIPFVYPYNLGRWNNFCQVLHLWREPKGDGIRWPVVESCHQYTLTIEQLEQKMEKRARTREYQVMESFSGCWFPCTKGVCVCCHPPCTDEPRIRLEPGDEVLVTRWKKYWLYGERVTSDNSNGGLAPAATRQRGWFPRRCAVQVLYNTHKEPPPATSPSVARDSKKKR